MGILEADEGVFVGFGVRVLGSRFGLLLEFLVDHLRQLADGGSVRVELVVEDVAVETLCDLKTFG